MALLNTLTTIATGINVLLILALLVVYGKNLRATRTGFAAGLLLFATIFLLQNSVALYYHSTMMPFFAPELHVFEFTLQALQTIAFTIMNVLAWK